MLTQFTDAYICGTRVVVGVVVGGAGGELTFSTFYLYKHIDKVVNKVWLKCVNAGVN